MLCNFSGQFANSVESSRSPLIQKKRVISADLLWKPSCTPAFNRPVAPGVLNRVVAFPTFLGDHRQAVGGSLLAVAFSTW